MVFDESREGGTLNPEQHLLLERVIDFGERPVRLVMVPKSGIVGLAAGCTVEQALGVLRTQEYSRYPIYLDNSQSISGFVHAKDLFAALRRGELQRPVAELQHAVMAVTESVSLGEAMEQLRRASAHLALVLNAAGGLEGIVTVEDLVEELFGEIRDEFDQDESPKLEKIDPSRWRVSGRSSLLDLEDALGVRLQGPTGAETVGALVVAESKEAPTIGGVVCVDGVRFTIERVHQSTVLSCLVQRIEDLDSEAG